MSVCAGTELSSSKHPDTAYDKDEGGAKADIGNGGAAWSASAGVDAESPAAPGREKLPLRTAEPISPAKPTPISFGAAATSYHNASDSCKDARSQIVQAPTNQQGSNGSRVCPGDGNEPQGPSNAMEPQPSVLRQASAQDGTRARMGRAASSQLAEALARGVHVSHQTGSFPADNEGKKDAPCASPKKVTDLDMDGKENTDLKHASPSSGSPSCSSWPQAVLWAVVPHIGMPCRLEFLFSRVCSAMARRCQGWLCKPVHNYQE